MREGDGDYAVAISDHGVDDPMSMYVKRRDQLADSTKRWRKFVSPADEIYNYATNGRELYVVAFHSAPHGRILKYTLANPTQPVVVVPEGRGVIRDV